jgi:hypothetical protein
MDEIGTDLQKQDANARTGKTILTLKRTWHLKAPFEMLLDEKKKKGTSELISKNTPASLLVRTLYNSSMAFLLYTRMSLAA